MRGHFEATACHCCQRIGSLCILSTLRKKGLTRRRRSCGAVGNPKGFPSPVGRWREGVVASFPQDVRPAAGRGGGLGEERGRTPQPEEV